MDFSFGLNLETFAGVSAAVTALIGLAKKFLGDKIKGREAWLSLLLPTVLVVASKAFLGHFEGAGWALCVTFGLAMGIGSNLVHDKISNPIIRQLIPKVLGMLKKSAPEAEEVPLEEVNPEGPKREG